MEWKGESHRFCTPMPKLWRDQRKENRSLSQFLFMFCLFVCLFVCYSWHISFLVQSAPLGISLLFLRLSPVYSKSCFLVPRHRELGFLLMIQGRHSGCLPCCSLRSALGLWCCSMRGLCWQAYNALVNKILKLIINWWGKHKGNP